MPSVEDSRRRGRDEKLQAHKISPTEYRVYNVAKGTAYSVLRSVSGTWYCTCPWAVKKSNADPSKCKHLVRVEDKENGCGACGRTDEYAGLKRENAEEPLLCAACRLYIKDVFR